jgi:uncharacterized membrane protein
MAYDPPGVMQYICLGFMVLITFYLAFLYIKSKEFHTYSCYNIIIMSFVVFLGGILNIFAPKEKDTDTTKFFRGLFKDIFNKLIMAILTMQVIILYIGIIKTELYYSKEKLIFLIGIFACVGVSVVIGILFNSVKFYKKKYYDYLDDINAFRNQTSTYNSTESEGIDKEDKEELMRRFYSIIVIELVFCGVIFIINVFCIAVVLSYISKKNKEAKEGKIEDLGYKNQLIRFVFIFLLNIIAIVISCTFLIFDVFDNVTNQSIYLGACVVIDICYSINKTVYNETLKIFCKCNKTNQGNLDDQLITKNTFNELEEMNDNDDDDN